MIPEMNTTAVIPIKQLNDAKKRLENYLSVSQRRGLCQVMFEDVLEAVTTCDRIDDVVVVTNDESVASIASSYSARVIAEPEQPGLIAAVTHAADLLAAEGVVNMVFLPGDVPLVSVEELEVVLDGFGLSDGPEFLIVPAEDLGGSNCVVCSPPNCIEFLFGLDSFRKHLNESKNRGIEPSIAKLPGLGLDVDTPDDLAVLGEILLRQEVTTRTHRFLLQAGLMTELNDQNENQSKNQSKNQSENRLARS
jgi:2-phospho-L-lactate guanylyltransferase